MIRKLVRVRWWQLFFGLGVAVVTGALVLAELTARPVVAVASADGTPEVAFPLKDFSVNENGGSGMVSVEIGTAPAMGAEVVVRYLTLPGTAVSGAGGDYIDTTGVLTFTHSSPTTQAFQVEILDDNILNEPDETINLILSLLTPTTATLGRNVSILVITDNDVIPASHILYAQPILAPDIATPPEPQRP